MSEHEVFKLKKELVQLRKLLEQQKTELKMKDARLIDLEEEADYNKNQAQELRIRLNEAFNELHMKTEQLHQENPEVKEKLRRDLEETERNLQNEITSHRKTRDQLEAKETQNQILKMQLKTLAQKYPEEGIMVDAENYRDEVMANRLKMQALIEKNNAQSRSLEQLSAENRVLRKMAGVPDDYQFQLNDIIEEGQLQVEKYRAQVRALEEEVEELEEERARLRRRLRENIIGGEGVLEETEDSQSRKALKQELKELRERVKQQEEELLHYKQDPTVSVRQTHDHMHVQYGGGGGEEIAELLKQNHEMKEQLIELVKQLSSGQPINQGNVSNMQNRKGDVQGFQSLSFPPAPLPGAFGNYNDIKEGFSYRFQSKLPVDMSKVQGDQGLDQMQVKYEIACLQLQNLETLRLLHEKEQEYLSLQNEVHDIKDDLKRKCLLVQDELFMQYTKEKEEWKSQLSELQEKYKTQQDLVAEQKVKIDQYSDLIQEIQFRDPQSNAAKLAELTKRSAILDVNLIKLSRKYDALTEEYKQMKSNYISSESDYIEKEKELLAKLYKLIHWKRNAQSQMKIMLQQLQDSVPLEQHHMLRQQLEYTTDKLANCQLRESEYIKKISNLESAERDIFEKAERIRSLEEELIEVQLEMEIVKKRLEALDPYFRKFQLVYTQMVDFIKLRNISPLEMFKMFDEDGNGKISKVEFSTAIRGMGINLHQEELEVLYMFVDLDGTGEIEYQEFIRRLRRSGVNVRKKEEELLFTIWRALQEGGLSLRSAFQAFDTNGDNLISKEDMKEVLEELKIEVSKEAMDYVFKIADTSGDGQISYDEFNKLFEDIVKNQVQENKRVIVGELDWKMQVMIKMDQAVKDHNMTLMDAFRLIDKNEDNTISLREFELMFDQMQLAIPADAIKDLFNQMDKDRNGEITYNEMLNYLRECKQEEEKLKKLKFIQERTQILREQTAQDQNLQELGNNTVMTLESRLQMKIAILEMRERNANQRAQTLINQLGHQDGMIKELNRQIVELQVQIEKSNENFYREREDNMQLKQKVHGAISKEESEKLKRQNEQFKLQLVDLNAALTTYRNLYDIAVTQTKTMRVTIEKIHNDQETLQQTIKEMQSSSDQNAAIGKLYHHVMVSRWNEGQTNQKFEKLLDELRKYKLEQASFEAFMAEKQEEIQEQTSIFRETVLQYERQVTELKNKLLPTVTPQRVEEQANRIKQISEMKFEVEMQNRELREKFYELQLKADYFDIYKSKLDEMEQRLKITNSDELAQQIIEVSEKYSECKIELLKTQRDLSMAKEKEDYYQRLNRTYTDTIKKLEFDLANSDLHLRKREEDWRRKFYEQRKTIFQQLGMNEQQAEQASKQGGDKKVQKLADLLQRKDQEQQQRLKSEPKEQSKPISETEQNMLKIKIDHLEQELKKRDIEIQGLMDRLKIQAGGSTVFNQQQLESYTKDVIVQEAEKLSMAAQQTIQTLQDIIKDKDNQLERKEQQLEQVRKEAMMHKKRDLEQIQQLNDLLYQRNRDKMSEQINVPPPLQLAQDSVSPIMLQNFQNKLKEKDNVIKELEITLEAEKKALKRLKDDLARVLNEKEQLQYDLEVERKKNEVEQYRKQVENLQKLVNQKNKELMQIKGVVESLKKEVFKVAEDNLKREEDLKVKENKMNNQSSEMEMKVKNMVNEVKKLKNEIRQKSDELELVRVNEIELKAKVTDLTKQNADLKSLLVQSGVRVGKMDQMEDNEEQVNSLAAKLQQINKLQMENATLQKENQFLKSQGAPKQLIDKDGNLVSQAKSIYFKDIDDLMETVRLYLASKPKVNLLKEFERMDKDFKRTLPMVKFQEILAIVGIKLKTRDQKLVTDFVKISEKGDVADYMKLFYKLRNINDQSVQAAENEQFNYFQQQHKK